MSIEVIQTSEGPIVSVNGRILNHFDEDLFESVEANFEGIRGSDLPDGLRFMVALREGDEPNVLVTEDAELTMSLEDGRVRIDFEELGYRKYWDDALALNAIQEAKRDLIVAEKPNGIELNNYDDDGAHIHLAYFCTFDADRLLTGIFQECHGLAKMLDDSARSSVVKRLIG